MPAKSSKVAVKTHATTKTQTQIFVATAVLFALGLTAYGFGFMPFLVDQGKPSPVATSNANDNDIVRGGLAMPSGTPSGKEGKFAPPVGEPALVDGGPAHGGSPDEMRTTCQLVVTPQTIDAEESRDRIMVAGGNVWHMFGRFAASATLLEDLTIDRVRVFAPYQAGDFSEVGIFQDGALRGSDVLPAGIMSAKDIDLSGHPIHISMGRSVAIEVWGKLNAVVSSAAAGSGSGPARSGNPVALGIQADVTASPWNSAYAGRYNVSARCASGSPVYAVGSSTYGSTFTMFKTRPQLSRVSLPSHTLMAGGDMDLYQFQASADAAGPWVFKKIVLKIDRSFFSTSTALVSFRLRRGSMDLPSADVTRDPSYHIWDLGNKLMIVFFHSNVISGSGSVYTLHGVIHGPIMSGDRVRIGADSAVSSSMNAIGYLTEEGVSGERDGILGPNIDTSAFADGVPDATAGFVWSDLSEVPHLDLPGTSGGSRDWIAGTASLSWLGGEELTR